MPLRDLVSSKKVVSCRRDATLQSVAGLMKDKDVGAVLVVEDNQKPLGIVTDRDLALRVLAERMPGDAPEKATVDQVMTKSPFVAKITDGLQDLIKIMKSHEVRRVPVVDENGRAVGLISFGDLVGLLSKELCDIAANTSVKVAA